MKPKSQRARINAYRKSGRMFGQTFNTGRPLNETAAQREHFCAWRELRDWFAVRNQHPRGAWYGRECVREAIKRYRAAALAL